ncbi:uncharacterized protein METZ01_LOCUS406822, partial [marine metagenome]
SFGLAIGAVPSRNIPHVVRCITQRFVELRDSGESFKSFIERTGKREVKSWLSELTKVPSYEEDRSFYSDWGDPREYTTGDLGVGECAGEVVSVTEFGLTDSERQVFDAQELLERGSPDQAARTAFGAMLTAARTLIRTEYLDVKDEADIIVEEFKTRFHDTRVFHDPFAGAKFTNYFFRQHGEQTHVCDHESAHHRIEEAQLFIEAAYSCYARMGVSKAV